MKRHDLVAERLKIPLKFVLFTQGVDPDVLSLYVRSEPLFGYRGRYMAIMVTVALAYTFSHGAKAQANQGYVYYGSIGILG